VGAGLLMQTGPPCGTSVHCQSGPKPQFDFEVNSGDRTNTNSKTQMTAMARRSAGISRGLDLSQSHVI
jgi:hypothetical protein